MSAKYLKLKPSNDFTAKYDMKSFRIEHVNLFSKKKEIEIHVKVNDYNANEELADLRKLMHKSFGTDLKLSMKITVETETLESDVNGFIRFIIDNYKSESARHQYIFANYEVDNIEDNIFIKLPSEHLIEHGRNSDILSELKQRIYNTTGKNFNLEFTSGDFEEIHKMIEEKKRNLEKAVKVEELPVFEHPKEETKEKWNGNKGNTVHSDYRKKVADRKTSEFKVLDSLNLNEEVALEGHIFHIDISETKNGNIKCDFIITDYTDSIGCRIFLKNTGELKIGLNDWVKVIGRFEIDRFTGEHYINAKKIDKIEPKMIERKDNAEKKRIELHAHTNMSEMSGVVSAKDLAKRSKEFGHEAIAVTDFGVVLIIDNISFHSKNYFKIFI